MEQFDLGDIVWIRFDDYIRHSFGRKGHETETRVGKVIELPQAPIEHPNSGLSQGWRYYGVKLAGDKMNGKYNMNPEYLSRATIMDWKTAELMEL